MLSQKKMHIKTPIVEHTYPQIFFKSKYSWLIASQTTEAKKIVFGGGCGYVELPNQKSV